MNEVRAAHTIACIVVRSSMARFATSLHSDAGTLTFVVIISSLGNVLLFLVAVLLGVTDPSVYRMPYVRQEVFQYVRRSLGVCA
jgi:hypothetical protein